MNILNNTFIRQAIKPSFFLVPVCICSRRPLFERRHFFEVDEEMDGSAVYVTP
jgi:hypothetical protein